MGADRCGCIVGNVALTSRIQTRDLRKGFRHVIHVHIVISPKVSQFRAGITLQPESKAAKGFSGAMSSKA